jgi:hypothetical protein
MLLLFVFFSNLINYSIDAKTVNGVEVIERTYSSSFTCLVKDGFKTATFRVYQSNGKPDPHGPFNIVDAYISGITNVDGFIHPCYYCSDATKQVKSYSYMSNY